MKEQKRKREDQQKEIRYNEIYDYFPYTHGESIENMKENYKRIVLSTIKNRSNSVGKPTF